MTLKDGNNEYMKNIKLWTKMIASYFTPIGETDSTIPRSTGVC